MKYAAAPWKAEGTVICDANGNSIASAGNNRKVTGDELFASLKLAAAAPDLLVALREVHSQLWTIQADHKERWSNERTNMVSAFLLMAEKAIAKATV